MLALTMPPFLAVGVHGCSHLGGIVPVPAPPPVQGVCACCTAMSNMSGGHRAPCGSVPRCNVKRGHQPCIGTHLSVSAIAGRLRHNVHHLTRLRLALLLSLACVLGQQHRLLLLQQRLVHVLLRWHLYQRLGKHQTTPKQTQTLRVSTPGASTQATTRSDPP